MFRATAISGAVILLAYTTTALADQHETSTAKEFQELGELAVGRWVGDIKFIAKWPGQDLGKGERVVGYSQYVWAADKKAIVSTGVAGNVSNSGTFVWDPASRQIKLSDVNTSGGVLEAVLWKKSERVYGWRITGGGVDDGRAHGGTGEWVFSEDGKSMTIQGQSTLGGEKLDPLKDVYKRLSSGK